MLAVPLSHVLGRTSAFEVLHAEHCLLTTGVFCFVDVLSKTLPVISRGGNSSCKPSICNMSNFVVAGGSLSAAFAGVPCV